MKTISIITRLSRELSDCRRRSFTVESAVLGGRFRHQAVLKFADFAVCRPMSRDNPSLAPPAEMTRYLAYFQRLFLYASDVGAREDRDGLLLVGETADTVHNVPSLVRSFDNAKAFHNADRVDRWTRSFPDRIRQDHAPREIVAECARMMSPIDGWKDLALTHDLSDYVLAPIPRLHYYLSLIREVCLVMRGLRNYRSNLPDQWRDESEPWTSRASEFGELVGVLGEALEPVPRGLVRWPSFDEERWMSESQAMVNRVPKSLQQSWQRFFSEDPDRS